jgi:hypothetical protein
VLHQVLLELARCTTAGAQPQKLYCYWLALCCEWPDVMSSVARHNESSYYQHNPNSDDYKLFVLRLTQTMNICDKGKIARWYAERLIEPLHHFGPAM